MSGPATKTAAPYRVTCSQHVREFRTEQAARIIGLASIERLGACRELHTIEVRTPDGWVPLHLHRARQILAAPVGPEPIDTPDGPLIKARGGWSKETAARADAASEAGSDAWYAALGPHEYAVLTSDGHGARTDAWHRNELCADRADADRWVRYERYTAEGRVGHGYLCPTCRQVTQTG